MRSIKLVLNNAAWPLSSLVALVLIWQFAVQALNINRIILPAPIDICKAIGNNFNRLLAETGITMLESVLGFVAGSAGAFLLAVVFVHSRPVQQSVYPYAIALKSTPLIAIAPLLTLWFGNGVLSKIVMSAMVAFFPVLVNSIAGLVNVEEATLDLMKSLSANWWQVLLKVRVPNSLPYVFSSLKIASSMAVVGAVIGEFTGSINGIGHLLTTSSYYLDTSLVFAGVLFITVAGLVFFGMVAYIEKRIVFW